MDEVEPTVVTGGPNIFRPRYIQRSQLEAAGKAPGCFIINVLPAEVKGGSPLGIVLPARTIRRLAEVLDMAEDRWIELDIEENKLYVHKDWRKLPSNGD